MLSQLAGLAAAALATYNLVCCIRATGTAKVPALCERRRAHCARRRPRCAPCSQPSRGPWPRRASAPRCAFCRAWGRRSVSACCFGVYVLATGTALQVPAAAGGAEQPQVVQPRAKCASSQLFCPCAGQLHALRWRLYCGSYWHAPCRQLLARTQVVKEPRWCACPEPYTRYHACEDGRIMGPSGRTLKPTAKPGGHTVTCALDDSSPGRRCQVPVSTLVLLAFEQSEWRPWLDSGEHINGDGGDNRLANLRWGPSAAYMF